MDAPHRFSTTETDSHQTAQLAGVVVEGLNRAREVAAGGLMLEADMAAKAASALGEAIDQQQAAFGRAMEEMQRVRAFVGTPENILGNPLTKHGEIAEQLEVAITNARDHMSFRPPSATFDGVGRLAPEDYLKDGIAVQSKFINGTRNTLDHVLKHLDRYDHFGRDGSYYEIPRDQHGIIEKVLRGEPVEGLNSRTVATLRSKIEEIASTTGRPVEEIIRPASSDYADVQQGVIHKTIEGRERILTEQNEARVSELDGQRQHQEEVKAQKEVAATDAERAKLGEAGKAALAGAVVGAGIRVTTVLYSKRREGKSFSAIFREDWKELGLEGVKGGAMGGISGGGIYLLTNSAGLSAPFAGAVVSSAQGVTSLINSYHRGEIDAAQCVAMGQVVCTEGAFVALGTTLGQAIIPIPVVGALVGSTASRIFLSVVKSQVGPHAVVLAAELERQLAEDLRNLDTDHQAKLAELEAEMQAIGNLMDLAFDMSLNVRLLHDASIVLAEALGVPDEDVIRTDDDLDHFMLGHLVAGVRART